MVRPAGQSKSQTYRQAVNLPRRGTARHGNHNEGGVRNASKPIKRATEHKTSEKDLRLFYGHVVGLTDRLHCDKWVGQGSLSTVWFLREHIWAVPPSVYYTAGRHPPPTLREKLAKTLLIMTFSRRPDLLAREG